MATRLVEHSNHGFFQVSHISSSKSLQPGNNRMTASLFEIGRSEASFRIKMTPSCQQTNTLNVTLEACTPPKSTDISSLAFILWSELSTPSPRSIYTILPHRIPTPCSCCPAPLALLSRLHRDASTSPRSIRSAPPIPCDKMLPMESAAAAAAADALLSQ